MFAPLAIFRTRRRSSGGRDVVRNGGVGAGPAQVGVAQVSAQVGALAAGNAWVGRRAEDFLGSAGGGGRRRIGAVRSQEVRVRFDRDFEPAVVAAQKGARIRVVFSLAPRERETTVVFPALGRLTTLSAEQDASIELGPLPPGEYDFVCQDRSRQGTLRVG